MDNEEIKDVEQSEEENEDVNIVEEVNENPEDNTDEVIENEFLLKDENENNHKNGIVNYILASFMDQLLMLCLSSLILVVFGFAIKLVGYYVVMPIPVLFIIYFIVGCLYAPILRHTKLKKTIGEKVANI